MSHTDDNRDNALVVSPSAAPADFRSPMTKEDVLVVEANDRVGGDGGTPAGLAGLEEDDMEKWARELASVLNRRLQNEADHHTGEEGEEEEDAGDGKKDLLQPMTEAMLTKELTVFREAVERTVGMDTKTCKCTITDHVFACSDAELRDDIDLHTGMPHEAAIEREWKAHTEVFRSQAEAYAVKIGARDELTNDQKFKMETWMTEHHPTLCCPNRHRNPMLMCV
jgi:hypothetical protein